MELHRRYDFRNQHFVGEEGRLIPLLQQAQTEDGYLRRERLVSRLLRRPVQRRQRQGHARAFAPDVLQRAVLDRPPRQYTLAVELFA